MIRPDKIMKGNILFSMTIRNIIKYFLFPLFFYFIFFFVLTYPAILSFSTSLWADTGDGLQNVWNIWWVNKAVTQLHQSIWKTNYLHYPYGTSLIGHTLNPLNGLMAIPLLRIFSLQEVYNIVLTFAFVFGGLTAFWLIYYLSRSFTGSLIGGYIYTFSNYHFAHTEGHLQTVSMEWIPLFILFWILFLRKPGIIFALGSATVLYFNLLSDYYYFFYCIITAIIIYLWQAKRTKNVLLGHGNKIILPFLIFFSVFIISSGKLIAALILQNQRDPLLGSHPPEMFSTDLLSIFIPGGHSRFADLTSNFWSKLPGNIHESSVYLGISVIVMLIYVWSARKKIKVNLLVWYVIFLFFFVLSLGPKLQITGSKSGNFTMPYGILEKMLPFLSLSGMPVRMMVMVVLSAGVIFAFGIKRLIGRTFKTRIVSFAVITILLVEYLPKEIPQTKIILPTYVQKLKDLSTGGVLDMVSSPTEVLYYQTIHEKPIAFGYIARIPQSVVLDDMVVAFLLSENNFEQLCKTYGFKYLITDKNYEKADNVQIIYDSRTVKLLRLGDDALCQPK